MIKTSLAQRIWYFYPYELAADVLSAEPTHEDDPSSLRDDASCGGICYIKLTCSFGDGTYLARVAASMELLRKHGYTVMLFEAQLAKAHPWDDHLLKSG